MSDFEFASQTKAVDVFFLDRRIGGGQSVSTPQGVAVQGSYQWPPDAPAEVRFSFDVKLLTDTVCGVEVSWPGLLAKPIADPAALYIAILVLGRAALAITTHNGDHISFAYSGPPSQPELVTGFQVSVMEASPGNSAALTFRYQR